MSLVFRNAQLRDLDVCHRIEASRYPEDEAASRENIEKRILAFAEGFLVAERDGEVVGFVNGGATSKVDLADEEIKAMIGHDPEGENLVIMSVVVDEGVAGTGVAGRLMTAYVARAWEQGRKGIFLLCKTHLIPFYEKFGFHWVCKSSSTHGGAQWHEMAAWMPGLANVSDSNGSEPCHALVGDGRG